MAQHRLSKLFAPQSIAIVGASEREGSIGRALWERVHAHYPDSTQRYGGRVYAVNPKHATVFGSPSSASVKALPERVDLALICAPARACPDIVRECGEAGCGYALILSHGFSGNPEAEKLAAELITAARASRVRIVGPNARGMLRPRLSLDASTMTGVEQLPLDGTLGVLSQSGAWLSVLRDFSTGSAIGFSSVLALGDALDLDFGELLEFFAFDSVTTDMLLYVETVRNAPAFMSGVRQLSRAKPVVVLKSDRFSESNSSDSTHASKLIRSDRVFDAAIARAGAVRVETSMQMVSTARLLSGHRARALNRLAIITNGKGPARVALDAALSKSLSIARFSDTRRAVLARFLPKYLSPDNPLDLAGDADAIRYRHAIEALYDDPEIDVVVVLFSPQSMLSADALVDVLLEVTQLHPNHAAKTMLVVLGGGASVYRARQRLDAAKIPQFLSPENAIDAIAFLDMFVRNQALLRQVPAQSVDGFVPQLEIARSVFASVWAAGRTQLLAHEAHTLLAAFGIAMADTRLVRTPKEAVDAADVMGYPVVLKVASTEIASKTAVGGVRLDLRDAKAVRAATKSIFQEVEAKAGGAKVLGVYVQRYFDQRGQRELYVGMATDPTFGATLAFGSGGLSVEQVDDVAFELPPINDVLINNLILRTRVSRTLDAYSNVPGINRAALTQLLLRFSTLVCACPEIVSCDLNPVLADQTNVAAVDARIVLRARDAAASLREQGRYAHLAVYPYPRELEERVTLKDNSSLLIRPIQPEDADRERAFVARLSPETLYLRFMMPIRELAPSMIERFTQIDYGRELALVGVVSRTNDHGESSDEIVGVARITPTTEPSRCEFAIVVEESMQGTGLARALMQRLIEAARTLRYTQIEGVVLRENPRMLKFCEAMGFKILPNPDDSNERIATRRLSD